MMIEKLEACPRCDAPPPRWNYDAQACAVCDGATLSNGLTLGQDDDIDQLRSDIGRLAERIEVLPRHRSLSLAVTKLDEARHWLRDRKGRAP